MKPFEIFMAGTHTDMSGKTRDWTVDELDEIAAKYSERTNDAPIVCGHPNDSSPAFGWISKIYRQGKRLFAEPKDVVEEFADAVKKRMYKYVSISLRPDKTVRHVGFLGGMPPAVKGLAEVNFAANDDAVTYQFADGETTFAFHSIARVLQSIRDLFIAQFGLDKVDQSISQYDIDNLKAISADPASPLSAAYSEPSSQGAAMPEELKALQNQVADLTSKVAGLETQNAQFGEAIKTKDAEIATLRSTIDRNAKDARTAEFTSFCDSLGARLKPADRDVVMAQLEIMHAASQGQFAEGAVRPVDAYKNMLTNAPEAISFAEVATPAAAAKTAQGNAGEKLGALTAEKMQADKALDYGEALRRVQIEHPDLAAEYAEEIQARNNG
ncbi:MAG: hypothetical protein JW699_07750 [Chitinispirillaceae bacterium]|nr:hypothetical protein [Chitinispirillaceae bacterium]